MASWAQRSFHRKDTTLRLENVAAVVVHHRSYASLPLTVQKLVAEGVDPEKIVVVDNSDQPEQSDRLRSMLPSTVNLEFVDNAGYGAAVNYGVRWLSDRSVPSDFVLVSTHESQPESGAVLALRNVLTELPGAAISAPVLVTGEESETLWSSGGVFTPLLGLPRHRDHLRSRHGTELAVRRSVAWADGAFLMFRRSLLEANPIDERFFLYMEETDHQGGLRRQGWDVVVDSAAVVWQSSGGTPPYYLTRNIQLFQRKNGSRLQEIFSPAFIVFRSILRDVLKGDDAADWRDLVSGWKAGAKLLREDDASGPLEILVINPLGGALSHYSAALMSVLQAVGVKVSMVSMDEPSVSGGGRLAWLVAYLRSLWRVRKTNRGGRSVHVLVVWPVLGFLDLFLVRGLSGKSSSIIYHDPKPLVRAVGTGRLTARLAAAWRGRPGILVHSGAAEVDVRDLGFDGGVMVLPHPMTRPQPPAHRLGGLTPLPPRPTIRVLGQFKQDRDLEVLEHVSEKLAGECDLEIVGRGWPSVRGWSVDARFVSEDELDLLIRTSEVILIPYKRFYQSGIAMRALEACTPIVGRSGTSLEKLYGADSGLLVKDDTKRSVSEAWIAAIRYALHRGRDDAEYAANNFYDYVVSDWSSWSLRLPAAHAGGGQS